MEFLFGISGRFFFPPFLSSGFLEDMAFLEGTRSGGLCFCFVLIQTLIEAGLKGLCRTKKPQIPSSCTKPPFEAPSFTPHYAVHAVACVDG
jgi:hypothetical protein